LHFGCGADDRTLSELWIREDRGLLRVLRAAPQRTPGTDSRVPARGAGRHLFARLAHLADAHRAVPLGGSMERGSWRPCASRPRWCSCTRWRSRSAWWGSWRLPDRRR